MKKLFSSGFFGLTLLCFCLPWVSVSCQQQKIMTATGIQMVSGMEINDPGSGMFGGPAKKQRVEPNIMAIIALVAAVAALFISLIGGSVSVLPALIGIATAIALKVNIDQDILKQGQGLLLVNYEMGFIGYIFLMAGGAITSLIPSTSPSVDQRTDSGAYDTKKCPMCAEIIKKNAIICKHCGKKLEGDVASASEIAPSCLGSSTSASLPQADMPEEALDTSSTITMNRAAGGFCSQCGTAVIEGALFCSECGLRICAEA